MPRLAVPLGALADPAALFAPRPRAVWLEVGFGGGEHLLAQAAANPDIGLIGCEPFLEGVGKAVAGLSARGLSNIRLHTDDAAQVLDALGDATLDKAFLLYLDPWPKKRHWKRRFVNPRNVDRLARVLRQGAELRFATDWPDYAAWALQRLLADPRFVWTAERADDWRIRWPDAVETRYEAKAKSAGRKPVYLTFRRA